MSDHQHPHGDVHAEWDAHYAGDEQVWSGEPNAALVTEVSSLQPGRALDVGCGEGADAIWLAQRGWTVRAIDPSAVAVERARRAARAAEVPVDWQVTTLGDAGLAPGSFDLVSVFYGALDRDTNSIAALADLVAPGGVLLFVHHATVDLDRAREHGFDPDRYLQPSQVPAALGAGWLVEVDEVRERTISGGSGAHHTDDLVVRARRA